MLENTNISSLITLNVAFSPLILNLNPTEIEVIRSLSPFVTSIELRNDSKHLVSQTLSEVVQRAKDAGDPFFERLKVSHKLKFIRRI